jgi:hypothetical protein
MIFLSLAARPLRGAGPAGICSHGPAEFPPPDLLPSVSQGRHLLLSLEIDTLSAWPQSGSHRAMPPSQLSPMDIAIHLWGHPCHGWAHQGYAVSCAVHIYPRMYGINRSVVTPRDQL